jgi:hypothetical protein
VADVDKLAAYAYSLLEKRANENNYAAEAFRAGALGGAAASVGASLYNRLPLREVTKRSLLSSILWGSIGGLGGSLVAKKTRNSQDTIPM